MSLDLSYREEQQALAASVRGWCERHAAGRATDAPITDLWAGLAELGVLALGTPEGGGGALEIAAAMEELGRYVVPGPLVSTFLATAVLPEAERVRVAGGDIIVAVGRPPLVGWAAQADLFVELDAECSQAWLAQPTRDPEPVETTAGEPWARVELSRTASLGDSTYAVARAQVALGAYLVGAGRHLLDTSVEYARDRMQFGQPIGNFQALAYPLADSRTALTAAGLLVRFAAFHLDNADRPDSPDSPDSQGAFGAGSAAATAVLSAVRAATDTAYRAHQTFGAMGFTVEGPVARVSHTIRQASLFPVTAATARATVLAGLWQANQENARQPQPLRGTR